MAKKEKWVYKFKIRYFGPEIGSTGTHNHSGLVIASSAKGAIDKLYNVYHEVYLESLDYGKKDEFDFDFINVVEYGSIVNGIIADEEDDYYGI